MSERERSVCPEEMAGTLDSRIRRLFQNPRRILGPFIKEGMTALDMGCGPGFFTIDMAKMVGKSGRVIASDLQEGMLTRVKKKITGTDLEERVTLHKCEQGKIGISEFVDFVLLFYVAHEAPGKEAFFREIYSILNPEGMVLMVEPPMHVSVPAFHKMVEQAGRAGFSVFKGPSFFISKKVVLKKV